MKVRIRIQVIDDDNAVIYDDTLSYEYDPELLERLTIMDLLEQFTET